MKLENWIAIGIAIAMITAQFINTFVKARLDKSANQDVRASATPKANHTMATDRIDRLFGSIWIAVPLHLVNIIIISIRFFLNHGLDPILFATLLFSFIYLSMFVQLQLRQNRLDQSLSEWIKLSGNAHQATAKLLLSHEPEPDTPRPTKKRKPTKP
jgi:hydrogenase-4 membrane subunit HyfE